MNDRRYAPDIRLNDLNSLPHDEDSSEGDEDEVDGLLQPSLQHSRADTRSLLRTIIKKARLSWKDFTKAPSSSVRRIDLQQRYTTLPTNHVSNAKYNLITFLPLTLFAQFKYFFNLYFLIVALSQFIPALRIGFLSTYIVPLIAVLAVTMGQEAADDWTRRRRDKESNVEYFETLNRARTKAAKLCVGDVIILQKDRRVPADVLLLHTDDGNGEFFVKTDQLDGETDWKLKTACPLTQKLTDAADFSKLSGHLLVDPPSKEMNSFSGTLTIGDVQVALSVDQCLWANSVVASVSPALALVIYTGIETRQSMNTAPARVKVGLLEEEVNSLSKILCIFTLFLSLALVVVHGFGSTWYIDVTRFLILFSSIIPISLRVNLDMGKNVYAHQIEHDDKIPGTVVRTSTIPEDLGRIDYLLTDKTGTLTRNEMEMKRLHVGTVSYSDEAMEEVASLVSSKQALSMTPQRGRRAIGSRVKDVVLALALCHNVIPSKLLEDGQYEYQAASPDELAIVRWAASVGLTLQARDRQHMSLRYNEGHIASFQILYTFPFNSDIKRMGIIVRDDDGLITFYQKGADSVMASIVAINDWLEEECANMAREGLRTLVIARRVLSDSTFQHFERAFKTASLSMQDRDFEMQKVISDMLERDLELLGLTGVEDKLQNGIKPALEFIRNAGIKIWMLTGDKVETAKCIAISTKLVSRGQYIHTITNLGDANRATTELELLESRTDAALLLDAESLQFFLKFFSSAFVRISTSLPAVICCRCSPTSKADVARLIKSFTGRRVACIGDGGNDVSMIQAADVGIGIPGKEGKQASLAADFSIPEFRYLTKLLVWHGRNSYKRSAKLAQFVIHRGLIISICQVVYSVTSKFAPIALFQGWLMVGYATIYTMMPVFSLALDRDLDESLASLYPELYKDLTDGKSLSYSTFFTWIVISTYQGIAIMLATFILHPTHDIGMVSIAFTSLVINELLMVALEIDTWHLYMSLAEAASCVAYIISVPFLGEYFDLAAFSTVAFYWKTIIVVSASMIPPWLFRSLKRRVSPPNYAKVSGTV